MNMQAYSHVRRDEWAFSGCREEQRTGLFSVSEIRSSKGTIINSYSALAQHLAYLGYMNHSVNLLFRGQRDDYLDKNERTKIYPKIYRAPATRLTRKVLKARLDALDKA